MAKVGWERVKGFLCDVCIKLMTSLLLVCVFAIKCDVYRV